ncbi:hypothetical protein EVG20_g9561 [Dentipellis fragilis]|uniref:Uncharacterized protein n=1 Tax=Dentipellis fragilis TaxID=205917 RepID=A0A4Y9XXI8_9AGAM|nr:hypothetical protein EVG20_g9561 [Dentipellis fragilis]
MPIRNDYSEAVLRKLHRLLQGCLTELTITGTILRTATANPTSALTPNSRMSKPVFYTFTMSVWSAVPELALIELGLADQFDRKNIDLMKGENFNPEFLKINPNATLPTISANGTQYLNTIDVTDFLVKTASVKVTPRTDITTEIHKDQYDPNVAMVIARSDEELTAKASGFPKVFLETRLNGIKSWAATAEAKPYKALFDAKIAAAEGILAIYGYVAPVDVRQSFFKNGQFLYSNIHQFYSQTLPSAIGTGPFIAGATPGEDDFHVGAWLAHIAAVFGATTISEGLAALEKGFGEPVPPKVIAYYNAWSERPSFQKVYERLH